MDKKTNTSFSYQHSSVSPAMSSAVELQYGSLRGRGGVCGVVRDRTQPRPPLSQLIDHQTTLPAVSVPLHYGELVGRVVGLLLSWLVGGGISQGSLLIIIVSLGISQTNNLSRQKFQLAAAAVSAAQGALKHLPTVINPNFCSSSTNHKS